MSERVRGVREDALYKSTLPLPLPYLISRHLSLLLLLLLLMASVVVQCVQSSEWEDFLLPSDGTAPVTHSSRR